MKKRGNRKDECKQLGFFFSSFSSRCPFRAYIVSKLPAYTIGTTSTEAYTHELLVLAHRRRPTTTTTLTSFTLLSIINILCVGPPLPYQPSEPPRFHHWATSLAEAATRRHYLHLNRAAAHSNLLVGQNGLLMTFLTRPYRSRKVCSHCPRYYYYSYVRKNGTRRGLYFECRVYR